MKQAIMFGFGNIIGRGFIGLLLEQAGYHVLFADINQSVIDGINTRKQYTVHIVDEASEDHIYATQYAGSPIVQWTGSYLFSAARISPM